MGGVGIYKGESVCPGRKRKKRLSTELLKKMMQKKEIGKRRKKGREFPSLERTDRAQVRHAGQIVCRLRNRGEIERVSMEGPKKKREKNGDDGGVQKRREGAHFARLQARSTK